MRQAVRFLLVGLLVAALGLMVSASVSRQEPGSAFAKGGSGAWPFVQDAQAAGFETTRIVSTPAILDQVPDPSRTLLAVFDASQPYSPSEVVAIEDFLHAGGRVLLADPYGHASAIGESFGIVFQRVRLVDPDPGPFQVILDGASLDVAWAKPSALHVRAPGATIIASSSGGSFLDLDGNGTIDRPDPHGAFPLVAEVPVGEKGGLLMAVADHGPFLAPTSREHDHPLLRKVLLGHLLPDGGLVLVDESRQGAANPLTAALAAAILAVSLGPWRWAFFALVALLLAIVARPDATLQWVAHRFRPNRFMRRTGAPTVTPLRVPTGAFWTARGRLALGSAFALTVLGLAFGSRDAVAAGALALVLMAATLLQVSPQVAATRSVSVERPTEDAPVQVTLTLETEGSRTLFVDVRDDLPASFDVTRGSNRFRPQVRSGQASTASYAVTPSLRGLWRVGPLVARCTDVLGLRAHQLVACEAQDLHVAPRQEPVHRIPFRAKVPTVTLGPHLVNRAGEGSEFHALRNYVQGDSLRSVNWKASARSRALVVNQRVHESMAKLTILLDARAVSGAGPARSTPLANGCRATLSVAAGALRVRDRVRIIVYGDGVQALPEAPGSQQVPALRDLLSRLEPKGETTLRQAVEQVGYTIKPNTPVLLASGLEGDAGFVDGVAALRDRGAILIVLASPIGVEPQTGDEGGPEQDAARLVRERNAALEGVRALGVPIYETLPGLLLDDLFRQGAAR